MSSCSSSSSSSSASTSVKETKKRKACQLDEPEKAIGDNDPKLLDRWPRVAVYVKRTRRTRFNNMVEKHGDLIDHCYKLIEAESKKCDPKGRVHGLAKDLGFSDDERARLADPDIQAWFDAMMKHNGFSIQWDDNTSSWPEEADGVTRIKHISMDWDEPDDEGDYESYWWGVFHNYSYRHALVDCADPVQCPNSH